MNVSSLVVYRFVSVASRFAGGLPPLLDGPPLCWRSPAFTAVTRFVRLLRTCSAGIMVVVVVVAHAGIMVVVVVVGSQHPVACSVDRWRLARACWAARRLCVRRPHHHGARGTVASARTHGATSWRHSRAGVAAAVACCTAIPRPLRSRTANAA